MFGVNSLKILAAMTVVMLAIGISAYGGPVPQRLNYQGTLSTKAGGPANGNFNMTFRIYSTATGTIPLWTETWSSTNDSPVVVTDGVFNVMLGSLSATPLTAEFFAAHPKTWLGVTVANDSEFLPRQMIASVGYAFAAGNGVPKGGIIMWSGTTVPEGWALCDGTNGTPNLRDRFIIGAGNSYPAGSKGGNSTINISHIHGVGMSAAGSHQHSGTTGNNSAAKQRADSNSIYWSAAEPHTHNYTTDIQGSHVHATWTDSQLNATQDIRPPYYALAFIMKL